MSTRIDSARLPQPARILVAEDDAELRTMLASTFRGAGFNVVEARDGTALLDCLADALHGDGTMHRYDAIVTDVRMPGYSGLDVLAGAQRILKKTPVVLITGFGDQKTHDLANHLGAAAVFDKPVDLDDLCTAVCELIVARRPLPGRRVPN